MPYHAMFRCESTVDPVPLASDSVYAAVAPKWRLGLSDHLRSRPSAVPWSALAYMVERFGMDGTRTVSTWSRKSRCHRAASSRLREDSSWFTPISTCVVRSGWSAGFSIA